jgi:hypothetical protein
MLFVNKLSIIVIVVVVVVVVGLVTVNNCNSAV